MDIGAQLTRITLGLDRLYRQRTRGSGVLDREGLVPVILTEMSPSSFATWEEADAALNDLAADLAHVPSALRRAYLAEMIDSLHGLVATFRGEPVSYSDRVQRCLRVPGEIVSDAVLQSYRATLDESLTELGYSSGSLAERVTRWETENRVSVGQVLPTLRELLREARERTEAYMFPLPEGMLEPVAVQNVPFSAYCDYLGRQLRLNLDYPYTRPALKHLACHEGFPGHFVHLAVREARTRTGEMPADAALVVTSSASSPLFEGIGENGIYFLDWVQGPADRLGMALNRLRSAARVNAALMIHSAHLPPEAARDYLTSTCYVSPAWAESRLAFLTHSLRAPFIFAYWYGDKAVADVWARVEPSQRPAFFQFLYNHMHTPDTLNRFWPN